MITAIDGEERRTPAARIMLEPLIVLTVLNCIFMFSSTVTTCALWWQHRKHRCCAKAAVTRERPKKRYDFGLVRVPRKPKVIKCDTKATNVDSRDKRRRNREKRNKLPYLSEYQRRKEENMLSSTGPEARNYNYNQEQRSKMSGGSQTQTQTQTANDARSTVLMEYSTVQKIVQVVDNDSENTQGSHQPVYKDIVIQKDTTTRRYDPDHVDQGFVNNVQNSVE